MKKVMHNITITHDRLREVLRYDEDTGKIFWKVSCSNRAKAGSEAGSRTSKGRMSIAVDGRRYLAHRLAWFYVHGEFPSGEIDHIDGDPTNNRISNLRDVDRTTNAQNNRRAKRISRSGLLGAFWFERDQCWVSKIRINGKLTHIGYFKTAEAAHEAFIAKKREHHHGCTL